jgi:dual specificity protein kinase YAK1
MLPQGLSADRDELTACPATLLQPLKCLTTQLAQTYSICDPSFRYEATHNPRRVLTKPSQPCHNNGSDNQDYDYILYVNDVLTADNGTGDK